jgi:hypothetical protein
VTARFFDRMRIHSRMKHGAYVPGGTSLREKTDVQDIDVSGLQSRIVERGQIIAWSRLR